MSKEKIIQLQRELGDTCNESKAHIVSAVGFDQEGSTNWNVAIGGDPMKLKSVLIELMKSVDQTIAEQYGTQPLPNTRSDIN